MTPEERVSLAEYFERIVAEKEARDQERFVHLRDALNVVVSDSKACVADRQELHEKVNLALGRREGQSALLTAGLSSAAVLISLVTVVASVW